MEVCGGWGKLSLLLKDKPRFVLCGFAERSADESYNLELKDYC